MNDPRTPSAAPSPADPATVTLIASAWSVLADLSDLVKVLPGDLARNAEAADRLAEELAEVAERLRSLPQAPREMSGHAYAALAAFRSAVTSGEDIGEFTAATLGRLASEMGGAVAVLANRPGSWEASLIAELLAGTIGPADEHLPPSGGPGGSL